MALVHVNWNPSRRELRTFGFIALGAFGLLGAWAFFREAIFGIGLSPGAARVVASICWGLAGWGLLGSLTSPQLVRPLYVGLTAVTLPIGFVVSHALMALVFYGLLTPIGVFFRLTGRDALQRRIEPDAPTYWQARRPPPERARYFRQF